MINGPEISVVMPAYNAGKFIDSAIKSILNQTFSEFEFIIINDGSSDETGNMINSFVDDRIVVINNDRNLGNYPSRNKGHEIARGKYICVMDADDIADKHRPERQFLFMEEHPEIGLAGSGFRYLDEKEDIFRESDYETIKVLLFRNICFLHPTLILRREYLLKYNLQYNEKYYYAADYDLIVRAAGFFCITNIPEVLLNYRKHGNQISVKNSQRQVEFVNEIAVGQLRNIGIEPDQSEVIIHTQLLKGIPLEYSKRQALTTWIDKVKLANRKVKYFNDVELENFFTSLLALQSFFNFRKQVDLKTKPLHIIEKFDLTDVTFVFLLRIESQKRVENLDAVLEFITRHFKTNVLLIEADREQQYINKHSAEKISYYFVENTDEVLHVTKYVNLLIAKATTPFVAVWDIDAICSPDQVIDSVVKLRCGEAVMCFPYDGRIYKCNEMYSDLFRQTSEIDVLKKLMPVIKLLNGYHAVRGAFIVNKEKYMKTGGDNEKIYGWGYEDIERVKRMEVLNLPVHRTEGPLFHLWHPRGMNSRFLSSSNKIRNLKELLVTCRLQCEPS